MKKFVLLYMSPVSAEDQMQKANPEEGKKGMEMWMQWFQKAGSAVVDHGSPLGMGTNVTKSGSSAAMSHVSGYSIVQAESMDEAKKMLENHPHFMMDGASIEVLEVMPMPGM